MTSFGSSNGSFWFQLWTCHQGQSHSIMSCTVFNSTSFLHSHLGICWGKIFAKEPSAEKDGHDPENNYIGESIIDQSEHNRQLQMVTRHQDKLEKWIWQSTVFIPHQKHSNSIWSCSKLSFILITFKFLCYGLISSSNTIEQLLSSE